MAAIARSILVLVAAAVLLLAAAWPSTAQNDTCLTKLAVCATELNSTKPSQPCCAAIKETVTTQLKCLCNLLGDKELLKSIPFNLTQALELPKRCGVPGDTGLCSNKTSPPPSGSASDGSTPPPGTPSTPKGNNAAFAVTWIGTYGLMVLLALSWSIVA